METVNQVKEALSARSRTATLEELASEGRKRVRLIRAEHVAAMIAEAVHAAIDQSGLIPKDEADGLAERSRQEFRTILEERQEEQRRAAEVEELLAAREQDLERAHAELETARAALAAPRGPQPGQTASSATADLSAAFEKLAGTLNDRLEKIGKKMGVSAAVEGGEIDFSGLFKDSGKALESNIENIQIKQKAGGGIAANLQKLKKLKGGG